jgi:hypothetical protein
MIAEQERALKVQQALAEGLNRQLVKAEARIAELEAEVARLLDIVLKEPHTAYLEAVQRSCDERMVALKHAERAARARADEAERQLAEARAGALEEAARICDSYDEEMTARAAEEIRSLSPPSAALQDRAPAEGEVDSSILSSSTISP